MVLFQNRWKRRTRGGNQLTQVHVEKTLLNKVVVVVVVVMVVVVVIVILHLLPMCRF